MSDRYVYDLAEGRGDMRSLLGGKGAGVAEMRRIGVPVPDGFTVTTAACVATMERGGTWPDGLLDEVVAHLGTLEERTGRRLGARERPLLVSVRSGAVFSMPGMMDTILNLGISDDSVEGLVAESGNARFAWDSYRRFVQMYGEVVEGVPAHAFADELDALKARRGVAQDTELDADDLRGLVATFRAVARQHTGEDLPSDPREQLRRSVDAVFASWGNPRAAVYRRAHGIPDDLGTAVNVMQMVFGNMGDSSATGVCFTRNPATGAKELYGEFLVDAQGEDVVAGIRTPRPLAEMESVLPDAFRELRATMDRLEQHYGDMQDIEFTVEEGTLYLLQTRTGKRTAQAALRVARELVDEGVIDRETALRRLDPAQLDQLLHPALDPGHGANPLTQGLNASPGAAVGHVVLDAETATERGRAGDAVVLVRWETTPDDIAGVIAAQGVLTAHGGMTSHAAVVARGMGKPCVAGAGALRIDAAGRRVLVGDHVLTEDDVITLDGTTGEVYAGALPLVPPQVTDDFRAVLGWADDVRRLGVRANADTGEDAAKARELGAEGIGLCRTEHMFFDATRISAVRQMILAEDEAGRRAALEKLLPEQRDDFAQIFLVMAGLPVTIRLLDPPLHEFLPHGDAEFAELSDTIGIGVDTLKRRADELHEFNPMLGHRGCRLGITYPEIYEMQARAIFEAGCDVADRLGDAPVPEVMIPLVATKRELAILKKLVDETAAKVFAERGRTLDYMVGTMIELPRAALMAGEIAEEAKFFSFGTNDLTQTTLGVSRDDAARFLSPYVEKGIYARDPFVSLDVDGVGELVRLGAERGRATRSDLKLGICGEHGGDPASIAFCEKVGLDYVSASPFRVPIARLAAAQAALA